MCDTICSLRVNNRNSGVSLFGKNSDRDPNEVQLVEFYPRTTRNGNLHTTYIDVEYEGTTNAVVISRPQWMWGAEMGTNEKGVSVGNEAIFSAPRPKDRALLGMDLLRLGLERGTDARSTANTIIEYLEKYGQGGSNDSLTDEYYNNLFLISDLDSAFELTVVGKEYQLEKVKAYDSVSNKFPDSDKGSGEMSQVSDNFSCNEDIIFSRLGYGSERSTYSSHWLRDRAKGVRVEDIFQLLRHHSGDWAHPREGSNRDICMHAGPLSRRFQTANSMVVEKSENRSIIWSTFSSNPCVSLYKPVLFAGNNVVGLPYDSRYWLRSERIHREYFESRTSPVAESSNAINDLQSGILERMNQVRDQWLLGEGNLSEAYEEIIRDIQEKDELHLGSLQNSIDRVRSVQHTGFYWNWWKKKDRALGLGKQ